MANALDSLLQHPSLWRGGGQVAAKRHVLSSGYAGLDACLPGGGWPFPALIELLAGQWGIGELGLLVPALRRLTAGAPGQDARALAWLNPPYIPYAPALAARGLEPVRLVIAAPLTRLETLWAMEEALRSGACAAVLGWADQAGMQTLRRLKLAADEGGCLGVLFRAGHCRTQASPAHLRVALDPEGEDLRIELLKVQGGKPATVRLASALLYRDDAEPHA